VLNDRSDNNYMEPPMTDEPEDDHNTIDELMAIDPVQLSKTDLRRIVAYERKQRAAREAGIKTKKPKGERPPEQSIEALLATMPKAAPKAPTGSIRRR
jgi:hypothetical protein